VRIHGGSEDTWGYMRIFEDTVPRAALEVSSKAPSATAARSEAYHLDKGIRGYTDTGIREYGLTEAWGIHEETFSCMRIREDTWGYMRIHGAT
jgi:hypothetical protein